MEGRRYKLQWSGKGDEVWGGRHMLKEELCEVEEIRMAGDTLMTVVVAYADMLRLI